MRPMVLDQGVLKAKPIQGRMTIGGAKKNTAPALNKLRRIMKTGAPRLLISRALGGFGDVLMTTPSLKALKHEWPASHLTYATDFQYGGGVLKDILMHNPYIDELVAYQTVGNREFDIAADITSVSLTLEHAAMGKPGGVPNRIDIFANAIGVSLEETGYLPIYQVLPDESKWAKIKLQRMGLRKEQIIIGIQVSASTDSRNWPIPKMKELVCTLAQDPRFKVIVFASSYSPHPDENWNYVNVEVLKDINIRLTAAMINEADIIVAPDSGLLHLAGALSKKIVGIFGPTDPAARVNHYPNATAVFSNKFKCQPCWYSPKVCNSGYLCLSQLSVQEVYEAVLNKIQEPLKTTSEWIAEDKPTGAENTTPLEKINQAALGVQRDFGGVGDIVCTTCAVRDLKDRNPDRDIIVAVPTKFQGIFKYNPDVSRCVEPHEIFHEDISEVFNLSTVDAIAEVKQLKNDGKISTTRPETYIQSVGGDPKVTKRLAPLLYVSKEEEKWARKRYTAKTKKAPRTYILTLLKTAEKYRDWQLTSYIELFKLADKKHKDWVFIVADGKRSEIDFPDNVLDATGFDLRRLFALTKTTDYVLTPDTALLHIAAAFEKPCITLFGPLDPEARCKHYKNIYMIRAKGFECMPCWRNANKRCTHKNAMKNGHSACLDAISATHVLKTLEAIIEKEEA